MPGYGPVQGDNAVAFNDQKRHITFHRGVVAIERIRYSRPDRTDFDLIVAILRDIASRR